jgi:hypothetical protein
MNNTDCLSLTNIVSFLDTRDNIAMLSTCKRINKHLMKYGFVTTVTFSQDVSYYNFLKKITNKRLISSLTMENFCNPIDWIPFYVNKITLINCSETYENILIFCMSNNYEIVTHKDNLIRLFRSPTQPQLLDI